MKRSRQLSRYHINLWLSVKKSLEFHRLFLQKMMQPLPIIEALGPMVTTTLADPTLEQLPSRRLNKND